MNTAQDFQQLIIKEEEMRAPSTPPASTMPAPITPVQWAAGFAMELSPQARKSFEAWLAHQEHFNETRTACVVHIGSNPANREEDPDDENMEEWTQPYPELISEGQGHAPHMPAAGSATAAAPVPRRTARSDPYGCPPVKTANHAASEDGSCIEGAIVRSEQGGAATVRPGPRRSSGWSGRRGRARARRCGPKHLHARLRG